jgi:hypothetical protein
VAGRYRSDRRLEVTSRRRPVMSTIPAPAIAITSASDPERPLPETGVVTVGGTVLVAAATSTLAVRARTDPEGSVPVAVSVHDPAADIGTVTVSEKAPVASVVAVASRAGAQDDPIVIRTGEEGPKPSPETVTWPPAGGLASDTVR